MERRSTLTTDSPAPDRKPVIWTVSVSRLSQLLDDVSPEFANRMQIEPIHLGFESAAVHIRRRLLSERCDALVAAGSNGAYLKSRLDLPLAMIKANGFDLLTALDRARRTSQYVGIVAHAIELPGLIAIRNAFNVTIEQRTFITAEEARACVAELVALGAGAIIGTGMVADLAQQAGVPGFLLYSADSVREAFEAAYDISRLLAARSNSQRPAAGRRTGRGGASTRYTLKDLTGDSAAMRQVRQTVSAFAAADSTVLLIGATGTGKERAAQAIHASSARRAAPFVAINCGALTESLLESELFGYEEGAFTGSRRGGRVGLVEAANGGSLFLDEIGEMPLPLQTRLLRVLEEREVMRVGSTQTTPVDVRVIAASHRDLDGMLAEGRFRADLYYRLNVLRLRLPTLAERGDDIAILARAHLRAATRDDRADWSPAAIRRLNAYAWPGNLRELRNIVDRLAALLGSSLPGAPPPLVDDAHLVAAAPELAKWPISTPPGLDPAPADAMADESQSVIAALARCGGDRQATAQLLGISRTTLWRRLRQSGNGLPI
jgi:propionate catabolism operon transcriptional regulator